MFVAEWTNAVSPVKTLDCAICQDSAPHCVSSMDPAAPEPQVDLAVDRDDIVGSEGTSKAHRGSNDIWDHFEKIKPDSGIAKNLHRNYDAVCKRCADKVTGKPEKMRRHLVTCTKAAPNSQLPAVKQQAQRAGSDVRPVQNQEKGSNSAPHCVSGMDLAAPEPLADLTVNSDDIVDSHMTSKGHRGLSDIWDHFKKIKLDSGVAKNLHRNYDAVCKGCADRVIGKPENLRRHLVKCTSAAPNIQLHALKQQAQHADSDARSVQNQEKGSNSAPHCVSSMDPAAPEPQADLTVTSEDIVDSHMTSKGHRGLSDIWDHFKKIKLDSGVAKNLHRNYDAVCKECADRVTGKPEKMRRHLVKCTSAAPNSQLHALE